MTRFFKAFLKRGELAISFDSFFHYSLLFSFVYSDLLQNYFSDPWNCFDFIIVMGSFIDIVYSDIVNVSFLNTTLRLSIFKFKHLLLE